MKPRTFWAATVGNFCEHYDNALFGLLAPFIAPLFFHTENELTALIYMYLLLAVSYLSRPLGALVFGWIGDRYGRRQALSISLLGMSCTTCCLGMLPTNKLVGAWAPVILGIVRFCQHFFAAGESSGGAIFMLEEAALKRRSFWSGVYDASSIAGIFFASFVVTILCLGPGVLNFWRLPLWLGAFTAIMGLVIRRHGEVETAPKTPMRDHFRQLLEYRRAFLAIVCAAGFSYAIYIHAFTLMTGFLPHVSIVTKEQAMSYNTLFLLLDFLLLPLFGALAVKVGKERLMSFMAFAVAVSAIFLFGALEGASLGRALTIRAILVSLGVGFAAPYHHWAQSQVPKHLRYTLVSLGTAVGAQFLGKPGAAIALWLYQRTGVAAASALFLIPVALLAMVAVRPKKVAAFEKSL